MASADIGIVRRLKDSIRWVLNRHNGQIHADPPSRNDLKHLPVGSDIRLDVYWKDLKIGSGPAVSVVVREEEILRIDCFGPGDGHMHAAFFMPRRGEGRLYFPEDSRRAQIDRAVFEITRNLRYYLDRAVDAGVRAVQLDEARIEEVAGEAGRTMIGFLDRVESPDPSATPAATDNPAS